MNWKDKWKDAWDEIGNMSLRDYLFTPQSKASSAKPVEGPLFIQGSVKKSV